MSKAKNKNKEKIKIKGNLNLVGSCISQLSDIRCLLETSLQL